MALAWPEARLPKVGQETIGFFIGCLLAVACSGSTSRSGSGDPQTNGGAGSGASAQSSGGQSQNAGGQSSGGESAGGRGQAGTPGGGMGGVSGSVGGPVCPPPTPTSPNPAGCPATRPVDVQASCDIDSALLCSYWEPLQNACPQSTLVPSYFRCCGGKWLTQFGSFTPNLTCSSGDGGAGGGP
jgi:hypothetical protein